MNQKRNPLRIILVALLAGCAAPVFAFQPVRWAPMDAYILKPIPGGPKSVQVLSPKGTLLSSARFVYNGAGRLIEERFSGSDGATGGSNYYKYEEGLLKEERLVGADNKVISRTKFIYKKQQLVGMEQFDRDHKLISRQDYTYRDGVIIRGVETTGAQKDQFQLEYRDQKQITLTVKSSKHGRLAYIVYKYDEQGRIKQRVRESFGNFSRCDYVYDAQGRIEAYAYYNRINGNWKREKKLKYSY